MATTISSTTPVADAPQSVNPAVSGAALSLPVNAPAAPASAAPGAYVAPACGGSYTLAADGSLTRNQE